jgi:putative FmdB family regulatory protein
MPIYEYLCNKCGHQFEEMQRITDEPIKTCPKCRKRSVERLISQTSFVLKGTGWYATDYAHKGASAPASKSDAKSDAGSEPKSGAKSDKPGASGGAKDKKAETAPAGTTPS